MSVLVSSYNFTLPWAATKKEDDAFDKWLKRALLLFLLFTLVFPWLPIPEIEREELEKVPPKLAKLVLQKKTPPPPPPKQQQVEKTKAEPKADKKQTKERVAAKKKVQNVGVAAFSKQLSSLRTSLNVSKLQARNTTVNGGKAVKSERSILGKASAVTSGGVSSAAISSDGSGTQLAGHTSTSVSSPIEGMGGGSGAGTSRKASTVTGGRDMESIRRTFEQHKGAIYAIYNRVLRKDPTVQGKFVFNIVIEPDGSISTIKLVSSELDVAKLEKKLLFRIRGIDFGAAEAVATPVTYKFDFLPS